MITPEAYVREILGDLDRIEVLGKRVRISKLLNIPDGDLSPTLYDHADKVAAWQRILSQCRANFEDADEKFDEQKHRGFTDYWKVLEQRERGEMAQHLHEAVPSEDAFKRKRWVKDRVSNGVQATLGRWRRNFTDDLVWGYVHQDETVVTLRAERRRAKDLVRIVEGIIAAFDHRMRCLSHLCARDRGPS